MGLRESVWPLNQRQRVGFGVLVALLLLSNPLYLPVLNLDLSAHTYSAEPVSIDDGTISVADTLLRGDSVDGIACSGLRYPVECAYERTRVQQGALETNLTAPGAEIETPYAYHPTAEESAYYRRTADEVPFPGTLTLEPVDAETVVDLVAVSPEQFSLWGRLALRLGWLQTDQPLADANRIVETDEGYVMLVETRRSSFSSGETIGTVISMLMVLLGLAVLWRSYKRLPVEW